MHRFLIYVNNAPDYGYAYLEVGRLLEKIGMKVFVVFDSYYSHLLYSKHLSSLDYIILTDNRKVNDTFESDVNLFEETFSDYERSKLYSLNLDGQKVIKLYRHYYRVLEDLIISKNISVILYENVSNSVARILNQISSKHELIYCGVYISPLNNLFSIEEEILPKTFFDHGEPSDESKLNALKFINSIDSHVPDYMIFNKNSTFNNFKKYFTLGNRIKQIIFFIRYLNYYFKEKDLLWYDYYALSGAHVTRNMKKFVRRIYLKSYFDKSVDLSNKYFLYPIHFHPESSTSIQAPEYTQELHNIEQIAYNLPSNTLLYVKEHPSAFGYNSRKFYLDILRIPNVVLIPADFSVPKLINYSQGIITITSTLGFEALLYDRNVYLLGKTFWENHPYVIKSNFTNLKKDIIKNTGRALNADNVKFLASYMDTLYPGKIVYDKFNYLITARAIFSALKVKLSLQE